MKVFKFGGASIKNESAIRNLLPILAKEEGKLLVVISALGKTTNALEDLLYAAYYQSDRSEEKFLQVHESHTQIAQSLFQADSIAFQKLQSLFDDLRLDLQDITTVDYAEAYDRIVAYGELFSTCLVSEWLNAAGFENSRVDIRQVLKTDGWHRNARIDWDATAVLLKENFDFAKHRVIITQGFIGSTPDGKTTTLGREGSDYSAAALSYLCDAEDMTVWKDVAGIFTADPAEMPDVQLLDELSYFEAIELSFFGAKIIHPKTIKPLQNKRIPLYVKSFLNPDAPGTIIHEIEGRMQLPPIYIFKKNQILISISPKDFSFITEDHLSNIFHIFASIGLKINVSENSALSFSVCADHDTRVINQVVELLKPAYHVKFNENLELLTIRHYTEEAVSRQLMGREVVLEQRNRATIRMVVKEL
ncbi:MAG: aspartate kinase [Bacteroidales bacterium]|nr:aspartate kinase [Bacteroidales bacterium]